MADYEYILPVMETAKGAWEKVKGVKGTMWGFIVMAVILIAATIFLGNYLHGIALGVVKVLQFLLQLATGWVLLYMGLLRALNRPVNLSVINEVVKPQLLLRLLGLCILIWLIVMAPLIVLGLLSAVLFATLGKSTLLITLLIFALIVITIYITVRLYLAYAFVLINDLGPMDAIRASIKATKFNVLSLTELLLFNLFIYIISALPLGIGLIWSIPYLKICYGEVYRKLVVDRPVTSSI